MRRRQVGRQHLVTALAVLVVVTLTGCGPSEALSPPAGGTARSGAVTSLSASDPTSTARACDVTIGAQLRERITIGAGGALTVGPGSLPCRGVGIWAGRFALDQDAADDPRSSFVATYTGDRPVSAPIPSIGDPCSASAVYFVVLGVTAADTAEQQAAAKGARADLHTWPAGQTTTVPGGAILKGQPSVVLAGSVSGDPTSCSEGEHVATPLAAISDCWLATSVPVGNPPTVTTAGREVPPSDAGSGPGTPGERRTRFAKVSCDARHTHEIYWVQTLDPARYAADTARSKQSAAAWARDLGSMVCGTQAQRLSLADDVGRGDIILDFQWPSTLTYPPTATASWTRAQVVCLARWKDGKPSDRHLLHR